ncbi:MAG: hypothetical protein E2578_19755 [Comamonas sp.]|nr:hypothetical protein [Comamonas sp.]
MDLLSAGEPGMRPA